MKFEQKEIDDAVVTLATPENPKGYGIVFASPISARENMKRAFHHKACWIPYRADMNWFCPEIIPDSIARAYVTEYAPYKGTPGGKDMFGIEWEYVPAARGSIVRPGNPTLKDITQWKEVIKFPDIDSWDWENSGKNNAQYLKDSNQFQLLCMFTGWFERLISFMDFGPAAYAMMNRKQQPYVKELFEKLTDMYIDIIDHCAKYYPDLDGFTFHDDWGAQHSPFFNEKTVREMIVPYMQRVTKRIHELGYVCELHSCGKIDQLIGCIVDAGWDSWDGMDINDAHWDYDNYGDKLLMRMVARFPADSTDEELTKAAEDFLDDFGDPNKPVVLSHFTPRVPKFKMELYRLSRNLYDTN
ncbi:MAG: methyltransferase [Firmicutes bacterium]|nr:methyltransferase [Bacillota bacterium]